MAHSHRRRPDSGESADQRPGPPPGSAQERAQLFGQPLPSPTVAPTAETEGYAAASPSDKDIGEQQILKRTEEYRPFTISVYSPFFWTSNAALVSSGEEDDIVVAPGVTLLYQPRITRTLYAELGVVQQFFLYDRFTELNFGSFDAVAGVAYYLPQFHNLSLRARYDYNRLTDTDDFDEFFVNHSIILSGELPFRIGRAQQILRRRCSEPELLRESRAAAAKRLFVLRGL